MPTLAAGRILTTLWTVARVALLAWVGYVALLFLLQRSAVFPGAGRTPDRAPGSAPSGVTPLPLELPFGTVEAWLLAASGSEPGPAILFAHGNGELIDDWVTAMEPLRRAGVTVLLVEFPGYGHSAGRPSRATLDQTFAAAYDRLAAREDVDAARIVAMGRSLGGGVVARLSAARPLAGLVLLSTFSSTGALAWEAFRYPTFLVRDRFDVAGALAAFDGPVLLLHGRRDRIIPFHHAERLAAARPDLRPLPLDCDHNDCFRVWPEVLDGVVGFMRRNGLH